MCCPKETTVAFRQMNMSVLIDGHGLSPRSPSPVPSYPKRVRYSNEVRVCTTESPLDQVDAVNELWYEMADLELFRNEARDQCRQMRMADQKRREQQKQLSDDESEAAPRTPQMSRCCRTRGLEQRSCLERQRRKYLSIHYILKASRACESSKLARVAQRCTSWASELAHEEGQRDFLQAHGSSTPVSKRPSSTEMNPGRCVRARPTLIPQV